MSSHLGFPMTSRLGSPMTSHLSSPGTSPMISHLSSASAWKTGWKNGWHQPTTTAAHLGYDFGHNVFPALIVFALVIFVVVKLARRKS